MRSFSFKKVRGYLLTALLFFSAGFSFTGCKQDTETEYVMYSLMGTWRNTYSSGYSDYVISENEFKTSGDYGSGYEGNNLVVKMTSDTAGIIYIKYTRSMNPDWSYSETAPDVGKWYAISYKNLSSNAVEFSGAYKAGGATSKATLEEAISEFTIANGYFTLYSACSKQ